MHPITGMMWGYLMGARKLMIFNTILYVVLGVATAIGASPIAVLMPMLWANNTGLIAFDQNLHQLWVISGQPFRRVVFATYGYVALHFIFATLLGLLLTGIMTLTGDTVTMASGFQVMAFFAGFFMLLQGVLLVLSWTRQDRRLSGLLYLLIPLVITYIIIGRNSLQNLFQLVTGDVYLPGLLLLENTTRLWLYVATSLVVFVASFMLKLMGAKFTI